MKTLSITITDEFSERLIKDILKNHFKLSAGIITRLKKYDNGILLNGERATVAKVLHTGDLLEINILDENSKNIEPVYIPLDILYEDEDILAVNKSGNMPTHPSIKHHGDTLANGVMYYYKDTSFTFRAITRLDRETSGIVLIAKNQLSAKKLSEQMQAGKILKEYTAITQNKPNPESGIIDKPIKRANDTLILRSIAPDGKSAITEYKVAGEKNGFYFISLKPKTGRTHQIRVHLASINCPIYADGLYGTEIKNERCRLHCSKITFAHPSNGKAITISAPLPKDFEV